MLSQTHLDLTDKRGDFNMKELITKYQIGSAAMSSDELLR